MMMNNGSTNGKKVEELKCEAVHQGNEATKDDDIAKKNGSQQIEIEISHTSSLMNKKSADGNTHKWSISVAAVQDGHDKSDLIKQVIFRLHESFKKSVRVISSQPFTLSQKGWGSFSLKVDIVLKNSQRLSFPYDLVLNSLDEPSLVNTDRHKVILKDPTAISSQKSAAKALVNDKATPVHASKHAQKTIDANLAQNSTSTASKLETKAQADAKKFNQFFGDPIIENNSNNDNKKRPKYDADAPRKNVYTSSQPVKPDAVKNPSPSNNETTVSSDEESLVELQHKIQLTQDMETLRNIVKCVENSGCLQKTQTTYDFDLNELDNNTLVQIRKILEL